MSDKPADFHWRCNECDPPLVNEAKTPRAAAKALKKHRKQKHGGS